MNIRHSAPVLAALVLFGVAACGGGSAQKSPFADQARTAPVQQGVVTPGEAKRVLDRYEKLAGQAVLQGKGWEAAEAGLSLRQTKADEQVNAMIGNRSTNPMEMNKTRFTIPRSGANPPWFLAEFALKGGKSWRQLIFQKTTQGWRVVASSVTDPKMKVPAIAKDRDGLATALPVDERGTLTISPRQAAQSHARLFATAGADPRARQTIAPGSFTTELVKTVQDQRKGLGGQWNVRYQPRLAPEIFALKTSAGGALIWYGFLTRNSFVAHQGSTYTASFPGRQTAALSHGETFKKRAALNSASTYLAVIPSAPGKVRVLNEWFSLLSITGS
ncbi:hypothetical protein [Nonomuraea guangzhouensis]|uniref:DUF8094 domain-containing protein n=1 Tax=Nonomuraea guangzhouensis TaxID=1291555 RepID=A0ABW4G3Z1_9ACTN|nr:hypothetical protein [Nonomuraea guangzhouensis]